MNILELLAAVALSSLFGICLAAVSVWAVDALIYYSRALFYIVQDKLERRREVSE